MDNAEEANCQVMGERARMVDDGSLELIMARTYPLTQVKAAYDDLDARHTHGKIVLIP